MQCSLVNKFGDVIRDSLIEQVFVSRVLSKHDQILPLLSGYGQIQNSGKSTGTVENFANCYGFNFI